MVSCTLDLRSAKLFQDGMTAPCSFHVHGTVSSCQGGFRTCAEQNSERTMPVQGFTPAPRDTLSWPTGHMRRFMASWGVLSILVCTIVRVHELLLTAHAGKSLVMPRHCR